MAGAGRLAASPRNAAGKAQRSRRGHRPEPGGPPKARFQAPLITCGAGNPLAAEATAGNVNDVTRFVALVDAVPPVRGRRGRPRRRPRSVYGDRAYHSRKSRRELRQRRIKVRVARPGDPHDSGLGRKRWVVERTLFWLHQYRRLRVRNERRADIHEAFLTIGCCLICFKQLQAAGSL